MFKVKLINPPDTNKNGLQQVLFNRGITNVKEYLNANISNSLNDFSSFGIDKLREGATALVKHITAKDRILLIVDSDADGFTSAALLINYLHDLFPSFVENYLDWYIHDWIIEDCYFITKEEYEALK